MTEFLMHIPANISKSWHVIPVDSLEYPNVQHPFLIQKEPFRVGIQFPTPPKINELKNFKQLELLSKATLDALETLRPSFHHSFIDDGKLVVTEGTSIAVTGLTSDKKYVISSTLDFGEPFSEVLSRLATIRRMWKELPSVTMRQLSELLSFKGFPPPQMVLSNVISSGIKIPIGGLSAGYNGTLFHNSLTIGIEQSCLMVDHRLVNPLDEQAFVDKFLENIEHA